MLGNAPIAPTPVAQPDWLPPPDPIGGANLWTVLEKAAAAKDCSHLPRMTPVGRFRSLNSQQADAAQDLSGPNPAQKCPSPTPPPDSNGGCHRLLQRGRAAVIVTSVAAEVLCWV